MDQQMRPQTRTAGDPACQLDGVESQEASQQLLQGLFAACFEVFDSQLVGVFAVAGSPADQL